jgi:hypothetical protein
LQDIESRGFRERGRNKKILDRMFHNMV